MLACTHRAAVSVGRTTKIGGNARSVGSNNGSSLCRYAADQIGLRAGLTVLQHGHARPRRRWHESADGHHVGLFDATHLVLVAVGQHDHVAGMGPVLFAASDRDPAGARAATTWKRTIRSVPGRRKCAVVGPDIDSYAHRSRYSARKKTAPSRRTRSSELCKRSGYSAPASVRAAKPSSALVFRSPTLVARSLSREVLRTRLILPQRQPHKKVKRSPKCRSTWTFTISMDRSRWRMWRMPTPPT